MIMQCFDKIVRGLVPSTTRHVGTHSRLLLSSSYYYVCDSFNNSIRRSSNHRRRRICHYGITMSHNATYSQKLPLLHSYSCITNLSQVAIISRKQPLSSSTTIHLHRNKNTVQSNFNNNNNNIIKDTFKEDENEYRNRNQGQYNDNINAIKNIHLQKRTIQGFYKAIQILQSCMDENNGKNYSLDRLINVVNLTLSLGKKLSSSNVESNNNNNDQEDQRTLNHDDLIHIALDLLQQIEARLLYQSNEISINNDHQKYPRLRKMYNLIIDIISRQSKSKVNDAHGSSSSSSLSNNNKISLMQEIIQKMENAPYQYKLSPDTTTYNTLLHAYSQRIYNESASDCESLLRRIISSGKPHDVVSYNIVLKAWSKSNDKNAVEYQLSLLREMEQRYISTINNTSSNMNNKNAIKPNFISFTILFDTLSTSNDWDAAQKANDILYLMEDMYYKHGDRSLKPSLLTYNTVLNAWSKSGLPGSSQRAQELLERMMNGNIRPNTVSFAICIKAYARGDERGSSDKALALLKQMIDLSTHQNFDTKPDIGTFNSVLRALNNDTTEHRSTKAESILRQIEEMGLTPDLITYNNILRCCCNTKTDDMKLKQITMRIAAEALLSIRKNEHLSPDPYTFNFFIKTCDRLISNRREKVKLIKGAFQFCKEEGQFSKPVLSIMKNALKPNELRDVLQIDDKRKNLQDLKISDFPEHWRNNQVQQR